VGVPHAARAGRSSGGGGRRLSPWHPPPPPPPRPARAAPCEPAPAARARAAGAGATPSARGARAVRSGGNGAWPFRGGLAPGRAGRPRGLRGSAVSAGSRARAPAGGGARAGGGVGPARCRDAARGGGGGRRARVPARRAVLGFEALGVGWRFEGCGFVPGPRAAARPPGAPPARGARRRGRAAPGSKLGRVGWGSLSWPSPRKGRGGACAAGWRRQVSGAKPRGAGSSQPKTPKRWKRGGPRRPGRGPHAHARAPRRLGAGRVLSQLMRARAGNGAGRRRGPEAGAGRAGPRAVRRLRGGGAGAGDVALPGRYVCTRGSCTRGMGGGAGAALGAARCQGRARRARAARASAGNVLRKGAFLEWIECARCF
jgi:hypothetical protein